MFRLGLRENVLMEASKICELVPYSCPTSTPDLEATRKKTDSWRRSQSAISWGWGGGVGVGVRAARALTSKQG